MNFPEATEVHQLADELEKVKAENVYFRERVKTLEAENDGIRDNEARLERDLLGALSALENVRDCVRDALGD